MVVIEHAGQLRLPVGGRGLDGGAEVIPETRDSILGKPWREVSHMTTTVAGTTVAYGDIASAYRIVDRVGMTVELVPHLFGSNRRPTGERGLYGYARVGGRVQNANAVRRLVTS